MRHFCDKQAKRSNSHYYRQFSQMDGFHVRSPLGKTALP